MPCFNAGVRRFVPENVRVTEFGFPNLIALVGLLRVGVNGHDMTQA
jgi:hypothetical protein